MKSILLLIMLLVCNYATACPNLVDTWKSSKEISMVYNEKFSNLEVKQKELLNQILGHLEITYTEAMVHEHGVPTFKVMIGNKESDFVIEDISYGYKVLSCSDDEITINYQYPHLGEVTQTLHFVNRDIYWVSPEMLPASREYFVRQTK